MSNSIPIEIWQKFSVASFLTLAAMFLFIPLAHRLKLLDFPVGRKDHASPTPVIGGLAMGVGIFATACLFHFNLGLGFLNQDLIAFGVASGLLIVIGQLDDRFDLPWWLRICVQALAAIITAIWGGVRAENLGSIFGDSPVSLDMWSIPFTVFATVGVINALNMIDGMDGFAGSLGLTALIMLGAAALYSGNTRLAIDIAILCGAVLAFLYFNLRLPWRRRAKAFLGNGGSAFLGFSIAWVAFRLTQSPGHPVTPALALWLVPVPLIDCLVLMTHRIRQGYSPFKPDHNHLHHLMRDAGLTPMRAVLITCAFSFICGVTAASALRAGFSDGVLLLAFLALLVIWYWLTARRARALTLLSHLRANSKAQTSAQATDSARPAR